MVSSISVRPLRIFHLSKASGIQPRTKSHQKTFLRIFPIICEVCCHSEFQSKIKLCCFQARGDRVSASLSVGYFSVSLSLIPGVQSNDPIHQLLRSQCKKKTNNYVYVFQLLAPTWRKSIRKKSKEITFIFILSLFLHFIKCSLDLKVELSFLLDWNIKSGRFRLLKLLKTFSLFWKSAGSRNSKPSNILNV